MNFSNKTRHNNKTTENKSGNKWECKERDAKITLLQESSHFIPANFDESFFRQFDVAMQLKKKELKKQGMVNTELSEITEDDMISAFGVTKDHMLKAAEILGKEENTKIQGNHQSDYQRTMDLKTMARVQTRTIKKSCSFKQVVQRVHH